MIIHPNLLNDQILKKKLSNVFTSNLFKATFPRRPPTLILQDLANDAYSCK